MMSTDPKRRLAKEIHGNQNYLNFIKKNHLSIQDQFNGYSSPKPIIVAKPEYHGNGSGNFSFKRKGSEQEEGQRTTRVIHDSLSKFQYGSNQINQLSELYSADKGRVFYNVSNNTVYDQVENKNNQIAANLLSGKTKHAKHEAAKELLFHLNKNRSPDHKKHEFKSITVDRYHSNQEPAQINLKFPIIEKKNYATIGVEGDRDLREKLRMIEKKEKEKERQRNPQKNEKQSEKVESPEKSTFSDTKRMNQTRALQNKFKIREELYGLLPSFKGSAIHHQIIKKNNKNSSQKQHKLKIQKANSQPLRESLQDYLERNILVKCSSIAVQRNKDKQINAIINRQILDATMLDNKDEDDLFDYPAYPSNPSLPPSLSRPSSQLQYFSIMGQNAESTQQNELQKEVEVKPKPKKPVVTELKYDGDLSVYELKIRHYRQLIFMVNLAHRVFDPVPLKDLGPLKPENKYKFYLGKGNNFLLIKSLLKRRFWWTIEEDPKKANFVWTQLKVNYLYQLQKRAEPEQRYHKLDKDFQVPSSPKKKKKKNPVQTKQTSKVGIYRAPLPPNDKKIFTLADKKYYDQFLQKADNPEKLLKFQNRLKYFQEGFFRHRGEDNFNEKMHNHLQFNYFMGNKKALFYNLKQYYDLQKKNVYQILPLTFHIKSGITDPQYQNFIKEYRRIAKDRSKNAPKNIWIVKPGQLSNRGQGITVIDEIYELNTILKKKEKHFNGLQKTYIVQKYLERPLLYKGRKFDIRHFMMVSRLHGVMRAYWFGQGYIRTSSFEYNIQDIGDEMVHLTNDAIQKYSQGYGRYQQGNKVSYNEFQRYMDSIHGQGKFNFSQMIYPKMKNIALDAVKATYLQLDPNKGQHNFQIFGLDFMIDTNYNVWLIQINTNPCLQLSSKLISRVIPTMLEQSFRLTLDVIYPPPCHYINSQKYLCPDNPLERLQYELIFDQDRDGKEIEELYENSKAVDMGEVDQEDETFENDGKEIELDNDLN